MAFCPNCKKYVGDPSDEFCPDCGTRLVTQRVGPTPTFATGPGTYPAPQKAGLSSQSKLILGVVVLVVIVVAVIAAAALGGSGGGGSGGSGGTGGGTNPTGTNPSSPGTYYIDVTQSGVSCGYGSTWKLAYGVNNNLQQTNGCGNQSGFRVTTSSSSDCIVAAVWVQAGFGGGGVSTTVSITNGSGTVLNSGSASTQIATISADWPKGCGG